MARNHEVIAPLGGRISNDVAWRALKKLTEPTRGVQEGSEERSEGLAIELPHLSQEAPSAEPGRQGLS